MMKAREALLLLGGNEDDPRVTLAKAEDLLHSRLGRSCGRSRDHWTEPWGFQDDRMFLNRAVLVRTILEPLQLLAELQGVEQALGRVRHEGTGYGSRNIDIDVLMMEDVELMDGPLVLPHPRMHQRTFALSPAADLCPGWVHPAFGRTVLQLLDDLRVMTAANT